MYALLGVGHDKCTTIGSRGRMCLRLPLQTPEHVRRVIQRLTRIRMRDFLVLDKCANLGRFMAMLVRESVL